MKILVLGAGGMLGNALTKYFHNAKPFEVYGCVRGRGSEIVRPFGHDCVLYEGVSANDIEAIKSIVSDLKPEVVINAIGATKHTEAGSLPENSIYLNSLFPHLLYNICHQQNTRLIHVSTDCVFAGDKGGYKETDFPDANDIYGRSKLLGEVYQENAITIRTSLIGKELKSQRGLLDWFLNQKKCHGFKNAFFSGVTTIEFSKILEQKILFNRGLSGIFHVSGPRISKLRLLKEIRSAFKLNVEISEQEEFCVDRSLDGSVFEAAVNYSAKPWPQMLGEMKSFYGFMDDNNRP